MIDDVESVIKLNPQVEQNLRWLFMRGPTRRVWPIVTLNASRTHEMKEWMEFFHTRLFGYVEKIEESTVITGNSKHTLTHLIAGSQFALREGDQLLNFWNPIFD